MYLQQIFKDCNLKVERYLPVSGGDINQAYQLLSSDKKYFLKVNDASNYPAMFFTEASGLQALQEGSSLKTPTVIASGIVASKQYLLLEWLEKGSPAKDFWQHFGTTLAQMHQTPQQFFGFEEDNYIGSLPQKNTRASIWHEFYTECRVMPLIRILFDKHNISSADIDYAENFCQKLQSIFPEEPPSLLHGDLWSGNYMVVKNGYASIYDPAVYYGHREMDLGMSKLFGGFYPAFYEAYNETYPLDSGWQKRLPYTQLYPLLVHAILFGGHYVSNVREILRPFG